MKALELIGKTIKRIDTTEDGTIRIQTSAHIRLHFTDGTYADIEAEADEGNDSISMMVGGDS